MAFIDAEIAKRRQGISVTSSSEDAASSTTVPNASTTLPQRQPATLGKLHEIDLGPDATLTNIERTAAAQRKLEGVAGEGLPPQRLGRDGKPWRGKKRRTSEDVRRDKLVEEVLRDSRCKFQSTGLWGYATHHLF